MDDIFALVDCNNFYVSCERVFNPKLRDKPVVVLSNNDGVIIARSNEVKKLGIKMATPIFKVDEIVKRNNIQVFSSNYVLYGDISKRVMNVLMQFTPNIEIYSIDEAFLSLKGFEHNDLTKYGHEIKNKVQKCTGIPVSIGIAKTKTLAKVANEIVKKNPKHKGVFDMSSLSKEQIDDILRRISVEDLWGVGHRLAPMLVAHGIKTAYDLKEFDDRWIRKALTVMGLRMVHELRGIQCISLEDNRPPQKSIACTRSFGRSVESLSVLQEAVSNFASRAAEKLREERALASYLQVFIHTNRHRDDEPQYANSFNSSFPQPTNHTSIMIKTAHENLNQIFKKGYLYKKAGVILTGLMPQTHIQLDLFHSFSEDKKIKRLMQAIDNVNDEWGSDTISFAACGIKKKVWGMRQEKKSGRYTTSWNELIKVK